MPAHSQARADRSNESDSREKRCAKRRRGEEFRRVLAIAGIKLGARSALGVDNDEWSYNNATENMKLNGVQDSMQVMQGELGSVASSPVRKDSFGEGMSGRTPLEDSHGFDMIVANIQRSVIEPLLPDMKVKLNSNGVVILSGLLNIDEEPMRNAVRESGFEVCEMIAENEWIAFAIQLKSERV